MSTKLETLVGYLSGREDDPKLLDELADPSSEASRFLESTRERSRALIGGPTGEERVGRPKWRVARTLAIVALIAAVLAAIGLVLWFADGRLRRLEAALAQARDDSREKDGRLQAALARLAEAAPSLDPIANALGRVEAGLGQLERRIDALDRKPAPPPAPKADPGAEQLRDDLAALRRDLSASEKAIGRQVEDLRASVQEVARLLRLLRSQSQPAEPAPPFPNPRPSGPELRRGP